MKKLLLITVLFCSYGLNGLVAQSSDATSSKEVKKECTKTKAECTSQDLSESEKAMAIQVAASTEDVEAKVCEKSGKVSFLKTSKCCKSGKETTEAVNFDAKTRKFVNASPSETKPEAKKSSLQVNESKAEMDAPKKDKTSSTSKAKACGSKSAKKGCCKDKKASTTASTSKEEK